MLLCISFIVRGFLTLYVKKPKDAAGEIRVCAKKEEGIEEE